MQDDFFHFIEDERFFVSLGKQIVNIWQLIAYVSVIYIVFSTLFFDLYRVTSNSMFPTLQGNGHFLQDDRIVVLKGILDIAKPSRGDIIVFLSQKHNKMLVKRVIGLPGDTLYIKPNRNIYINGKPQICFFHHNYRWARYVDYNGMPKNGWGSKPFIVPQNNYFVMGDNTNDSEDSRMWGWVPQNRILGTVSFIWFPLFRVRSFRNENLSR